MERFRYYLCENENEEYYIVRKNVEWNKEDYGAGQGIFKDQIEYAFFYNDEEEALEIIYNQINNDKRFTEKSRRLIETD